MCWNTLVKYVEAIRPIIQVVAIAAGAVAALMGLSTYRQSVRLEKAKWMKDIVRKVLRTVGTQERKGRPGWRRQTEDFGNGQYGGGLQIT